MLIQNIRVEYKQVIQKHKGLPAQSLPKHCDSAVLATLNRRAFKSCPKTVQILHSGYNDTGAFILRFVKGSIMTNDKPRDNIAIAIDGGGVKGAMVAYGIIELEKYLGLEEGQPLISDPRVKVLAGTSTGAGFSKRFGNWHDG